MYEDRTFLLNPDNADILNGARRNPLKIKKPPLWIMIPLMLAVTFYAVVSVVWASQAFTELQDWFDLNQRGVAIEGQLTGRDFLRPRHRDIFNRFTYYLDYTFTTPSGVTRSGRVQVREEAYLSYSYGKQVQVLYVPDRSSASRLIEDHTLELQPLAVAGAVNAAIVLAVILIIPSELRRQRNHQRFEREGRVIYGRVVKAALTESESKGKRQAMLYLNYQFTSPTTSKVLPRMQGQRRDDLTEADLPLVGNRVAVLYVNDRLFTVL